MADLHQDYDDKQQPHDVPPTIALQNNQFLHHLHQFDAYPPDLEPSSSQHFFHRRFHPISSLHPQNHVSFVIDMFHQRVQQSQAQSRPHSASRSIEDNHLFHSNPNFRVTEENDDTISNEFGVDFGPGFLFENYDNPNCENDDNLGFMVADPDEAGENEIIQVVDEDYEEEQNFHLCWDAFHLEDEITNPNPNFNPNANEDFEWEEVADRINETDFFGAEPDDDASVSPVILTGFELPREEHDASEWQVLSNVRNFEPNTDSEDRYEDYNYAEYEMFFGQFADNDVSYSGCLPASKTAIVNLSTVVMTKEDVANDNALCAVCKDEVVVGEMATQLPCSHRYHGDCILTWLAVRNTCPVCRHELPTDDVDYERRNAERG